MLDYAGNVQLHVDGSLTLTPINCRSMCRQLFEVQ